MGTRREFSREFKVEAVKLVKERGVTAAQAARDLDVHENVLRKWVRELAADPQQAFLGKGVMKPEQAEIDRLRKEVAKLKMERDILKKAAVGSTIQRNTFFLMLHFRGGMYGCRTGQGAGANRQDQETDQPPLEGDWREHDRLV
jgi:transposase